MIIAISIAAFIAVLCGALIIDGAKLSHFGFLNTGCFEEKKFFVVVAHVCVCVCVRVCVYACAHKHVYMCMQ